MPLLTLLLVDDHALFRTGLAMVISTAVPHARVVEAASLDEALELSLPALDAVLLDLQLGALNGLECIPRIRQRWPGAPIVIVSAFGDAQSRRVAAARGAEAFVDKSESADRMVSVVRSLVGLGSDAPLHGQRLSARQREVIDHLHRGLSNKLIAHQLGLSENTVRRHVQDILRFFDVGNRAEAVYAARQRGLVG